MRAGLLNKTVTVNTENGIASSILNLLDNKTKQDDKQTKTELHITQLIVAEKQAGLREQAEVAFGVAFYINGNKTIEYNGSSNIQTGGDASAYISQLIVSNIDRCLKEFDKRMADNQSVNGVVAEVQIDSLSTDKDIILYSKSKKLWYSDFKGPEDDLSIATALTYSGINMRYQHGQEKGHIKLKITLSCYFDMNKSWCRVNGRNEKVLNHEQLHFDITALNTCNLAKAIKDFNFTVENYETELNQLLKDADKEGMRLQNLYDKETTHGIKNSEQERWNKDIRGQLTTINCY
jgi:hypothetical protein